MMYEDNSDFMEQYQPVIDEQALVPPQITLIRRMYGLPARKDPFATPGCISQMIPDYSALNPSFFNMDDKQRSFIATNFYNIDEDLRDYLILQEVLPDPNAKPGNEKEGQIFIIHPKDVL